MRCFTITETKNVGLRVTVFEDVVGIQVGKSGEVHYVPLSEDWQDMYKKLARDGADDLMRRNPIEWAVWDSEVEDLGPDTEHGGTEALVHVATAPGEGLSFTSPAFTQRVINKEVISTFEQFPSAGVEVLAIGGDENHMLLKMNKKAGFRLLRPEATGRRWFWSSVTWTGRDLLHHPHFRKGQRRAA